MLWRSCKTRCFTKQTQHNKSSFLVLQSTLVWQKPIRGLLCLTTYQSYHSCCGSQLRCGLFDPTPPKPSPADWTAEKEQIWLKLFVLRRQPEGNNLDQLGRGAAAWLIFSHTRSTPNWHFGVRRKYVRNAKHMYGNKCGLYYTVGRAGPFWHQRLDTQPFFNMMWKQCNWKERQIPLL